MDAQPGSTENLRRKLSWAVRHVRANIGAFTPAEPEEMVRERLIDAATVPTELRTDYVRYKRGLTKRASAFVLANRRVLTSRGLAPRCQVRKTPSAGRSPASL